MIQPSEAGYLHHESTQQSPPQAVDLDAFRRWVVRRNAARKQIRRLSPRELEVVMLVADGLANKSIALRLEISVKTIEKHRANAARKLGVSSTAEMVRLAVESDPDARDFPAAETFPGQTRKLDASATPVVHPPLTQDTAIQRRELSSANAPRYL
jgi:DNA-binding CsgD family transcriptional regulator